MTDYDRKMVIHLRYGSFTDFSRPLLSILEIVRRLGIRESTVRKFLRVFAAQGYSFERLGHY